MQTSGKKLIVMKHKLAKPQAKNVPKRGKMTRREVTVSNTSNGLDGVKAAASNTSDDLGHCCIKYKQRVVGDVGCR